MPDAAALTFAIEFATDKGKAALQALVPDVVGIVQSILAPISPSNLVTQIAQQGLGINSLGSNLVNGGVAALGNSRFGYLANMGVEFNAESQAMSASISDVRNLGMRGISPTDEMRDSIWARNYADAKVQEREELEFKKRLGPKVAENDIEKAISNGTRLWGDVKGGWEFLGQGGMFSGENIWRAVKESSYAQWAGTPGIRPDWAR